jgi:type II secretory pathway component PulJ
MAKNSKLARCLNGIIAEIQASKVADRQISRLQRKISTLEGRLVALEMHHQNQTAVMDDDEEVVPAATAKAYTTENNVIYLSLHKPHRQESRVS